MFVVLKLYKRPEITEYLIDRDLEAIHPKRI